MTTIQTTLGRMDTRNDRNLDGGDSRNPYIGGTPYRDASGREYDLAALADQLRFLVPESILPNLHAPTRDLAIRTMVGSLAEAGAIPDADQESIGDAIIRREQLGSTAIGRGIAIPHTKHMAVDRVVATMAFSREGIEFNSVDGQPVHLAFLLVSPPNSTSEHLRALEAVSSCLADRQYRHWRSDQRHTDDESGQTISDPGQA